MIKQNFLTNLTKYQLFNFSLINNIYYNFYIFVDIIDIIFKNKKIKYQLR